MENLSSQQEIWMALSDLFIDNDISYELIAKRVAHLTMSEVEHILYYEVAPVCIGNLLTPIPPIWQRFSENDIIPNIEEHLHRFNSKKFYRYKVILKMKAYKILLKKIG